MSLRVVRNIPFLKALVFKLWLWDARRKLSNIGRYLVAGERIIEIGSGPGSVALMLKRRGFDVTAVDVRDLSFSDEVRPRIYDGENLPYEDTEFDVALILTVLHHAHNPEAVVLEAKRVARRVIVIEDIFTRITSKYITFAADCIVNLEFFDHPHNNKTDEGWKDLFKRSGLKLVETQLNKHLLFFKQVTYFLERENEWA